jgi:2,3,4,5-tetrahydropyridine-2-carboxylate N-succinyltransferase
MEHLQTEIEKLAANPEMKRDWNVEKVLHKFIDALNNGEIRAAQQIKGKWITNTWVKEGILQVFRFGRIVDLNRSWADVFDKDFLVQKRFLQEDEVRIVLGGTGIRNGCYLEKGVVCMSPSYINIGAYIGSNTMVDSHALVGTCAQIGKNVHISAATQIGGVLEPINATPVIVEDNVMLGGNCGIYEGVIIKQNAVLGSGVILNSSTKVYDLVKEKILTATDDAPLTIPENAVVVPGARAISGEFGQKHNLSIATPLIIKYRDSKTDAKTALDMSLRNFD